MSQKTIIKKNFLFGKMQKRSIKNWASKVFTRDLDLPKYSFIYLLITLFAIALIVEFFLFEYIVLIESGYSGSIERTLVLIFIVISFLISGILVDIKKNKTWFFNAALLLCTIGLFLFLFKGTLFQYVGLGLVLLLIPLLFIVWFSTLVHATNILNRGRITAILIVFGFLLGLIGIGFTFFDNLHFYFFLLEFILLFIIIWWSRKYKYRETEERLESDKKYFKIIFEKHFFRYSSSFTLLSFLLGNLIAQHGFNIDIFTFSIASFFYLIASGCFLDNIGRKNSIVLGILVLSFFLISSGSFIGSDYIFGIPKKIFLSLHYAFSLTPLILAIITVSGDFSTERGNIKYRGRINGLFMALMIVGIIFGFLFNQWINILYTIVPILNLWIPNFPNLINSFVLVILLVWMMAMKEFLISKETKWATMIKDLYIFSYNGICLYHHNFEKSLFYNKEKIDEDLISSGLTGVITMITEITKSKKRLRKIDKEGLSLYFSYGKNHMVALISTMDLPVIVRKLDDFSKEFEDKFQTELKSFIGKVTPFEQAKYLVKKYFYQKYTIFME